MTHSPSFVHHASTYRDLLQEYCKISSTNQLSEAEASRIANILHIATTDPMLSFLLDEADHMLAHYYHLIDETDIIQQQQKLQANLDQHWIEQMLLDISSRSQESQRKHLQQFLKEKGFYGGSIDGVVGPKTQAAIQSCSASGEFSPHLFPTPITDIQD